MVDPIALWHAEHVRFAQLLDFLARGMTAFLEGGRPDYGLMYDAVYYLHHYGDRFHHPREDVAFARLVARDRAMALPINRLLQEHRVIAAAGQGLLEWFEDILEDALVERARVQAAATTYLVYYRHHLATEETEVLPRAAELLTPDDWEAVANAVAASADPLFGDDSVVRYRRLREQISHRDS